MATVKVPSGTVEATHRHPLFGPCVIAQTYLHNICVIYTNNGSASVPFSTLREV